MAMPQRNTGRDRDHTHFIVGKCCGFLRDGHTFYEIGVTDHQIATDMEVFDGAGCLYAVECLFWYFFASEKVALGAEFTCCLGCRSLKCFDFQLIIIISIFYSIHFYRLQKYKEIIYLKQKNELFANYSTKSSIIYWNINN